MRKCPICKKKTIPYIWMFFNKYNGKKSICIECSNCKNNIIKKRFSFIQILKLPFYSLELMLFLLLIIFVFLDKFTHNTFLEFTIAFIVFSIYFLTLNLMTPLRKATYKECLGHIGKVEAIFNLILMVFIIFMLIYFFIIAPYVFGINPFAKGWL